MKTTFNGAWIYDTQEYSMNSEYDVLMVDMELTLDNISS